MHYRSLRLAAAAGFLVVGTCASTANQAEAGPARPAPSLPAPNGPVLHVTTEPELQTAMQQLESNTTIVLAPGTYRLTRSLYVNGTDSHVGIRGATDDPDDLVIVGAGMSNASYGSVPYGIWTGGNVQDITIANLTIRDVYFSPHHLQRGHRTSAGPQRPSRGRRRAVREGQSGWSWRRRRCWRASTSTRRPAGESATTRFATCRRLPANAAA